MDTEAASREIVAIRKRLTEIEEERSALADNASTEKADHLDEEHELQARLAQLLDSFSSTDHEITKEFEDPRRGAQQPIV